MQYKEDDPDLRKEGFIVDDFYCSQSSSIIEGEENEHTNDASRKELLIKQLERIDNRVKTGTTLSPYILLNSQVDLGDFNAVSFKKRVKKNPPSRMSFGNVSTADEYAPEFPISVIKVKKVDTSTLDI
jgi:hypothetical protein